MKKIFLCLIIFSIPQICFGNTFVKTKIQDIDFSYVVYGVGSEVYNIKIAVTDEAQPLEDLALKYNGITAINGIFFCPADYSQCNGNSYTINERFSQGEDLSFYQETGDRGVFGWNSAGEPFIHQTGKINPEKRADIHEGLGNFPILYANGKNMLEHYHDVGLYDIKMKVPLPRHFICSDKRKSKIIFGRTGPTSLDNLAPVLYDLGCWDALNLDAGNSAQYIYNGNKIVSGPRDILDGIVIERVGLNTQELEDKLETIMDIISPTYYSYGFEKAQSELINFIAVIPKIRTEIYDKNSDDIFDASGNRIGYQINTIDLHELKRIYLLSGLERRLKVLLYDLEQKENERLQRIEERKQEQKTEIN